MTSEHPTGQTFEVLVVGNGGLGLSLGLTLARRGTKVAVLGRDDRPWAASTAAGAMLGTFSEVTTTLLATEEGRSKLDLGVEATKLWAEWLAGLDDQGGTGADLQVADGTVMLLNSVGVPGIDSANYTAIRESLEQYGEPFEDIDPADVEWLDPNPTTRPLKGMFLPNEHAVDAAALLQRLEAAFVRAGGQLITGFGERLVHSGGRITGVQLTSGDTVTADQVVLAAGAASQTLLDTVPEVAAAIPRLVSGVGVSVVARVDPDKPTPRSVLRTPNRAFACGLHVVPRSRSEIYLGATNAIAAQPADVPSVRDTTFLLHCALRQLRRDIDDTGIARVQVGNRPVAMDGFPLVGRTGLDGLWMMTGTYRDGLHLSPLLAQEMTRRLLEEESEYDLSRFGPVRSPIQAQSRADIVDTAVTHLMATGYEDEWTIPNAWPKVLEAQLHADFARFAAELDPEYTPPAEILAKARVSPGFAKQVREYYAAGRSAA
ncbi:NAD(P)/FAD-dependent oxidoreductase [Streptomyces coffeae]|uniref:FAD-dependent oxidoreductase n=1 Tax=Streptomyces coffeae TaxID=621382 RepID=A0ABS1NSB2_9ACTN|nr:FAD-dependent oxidoreductase [Streptomyces coffeae]MBL1102641.1 FAD-dependent oxidoreductase [Streptomyces coffeae]